MDEHDIEAQNTCGCCGFAYPVGGVQEYDRQSVRARGEKILLCDVCASTYIASARDYGHEGNYALTALGWVVNQIRKDIEGLKKQL